MRKTQKTKDLRSKSKEDFTKRTASSAKNSAFAHDDFLKAESRNAKASGATPWGANPEAASCGIRLSRPSDLLRGILTQNPGTEVFTLETIMRALGEERFDANLLFATLPSLEAAPSKPAMIEVSAALMAGQMAVGRRGPALPRTLLDREIPRHSLAVAIHAALPVVEAAEKFARPRLKWLNHPVSRRILGAFLFVLTATVAFPLIGFDPLQSLSTFAISFGMAEGDGAAILLGVMVGVVALGLIAASNFSTRALRSKAAGWLRKLARKIAGSLLARLCDRLGLGWIAKLLRFEWTQLLLLWRPEGRAAPLPTRTMEAATA
ncbi:MAG: exopolysaccharide biosynthesis protein [Neomegalonema sp.]|nr:exopolysaccharide biosynthesis protein [Neomegalonema sp.]MDD2867464.1 exopolysaccharide biosynthesis protein [Neomegalonema sp.]